ncbi:hypothetical protein [Brevundimonas diminuta]
MTTKTVFRPIRLGSAKALTRAVTEGPINEPNSQRKFLIGGE